MSYCYQTMYYNLNHNYGKVAVKNASENHVAVYNQNGQLAHCLYCGEVDISFTGKGLVTSFFGSSGYKIDSDDSWMFCKGLLVALVVDKECYVVTENGKPIDCCKGHFLYEQVNSIISDDKLKFKNNVFRLKPE